MRKTRKTKLNRTIALIGIMMVALSLNVRIIYCQAVPMKEIERQFRELPAESRQYMGPLFWLHGTETKERLDYFIEKIAELGNGSFTAESRPHNDWLGPGWYRDLGICLDAAKKNNLKMWIFDERWYPSQGVDWKVPPEYAAKKLETTFADTNGPLLFEGDGYSGERYIATVAGRITNSGTIESNSLIDLAPYIKAGKLTWQVPNSKWKVMKFTHIQARGSRVRQGKQLLVDGASKDCVDWFLQTVYQPHYDHFSADFGKTIMGYFYDEPETPGDWGTELNKVFAEWNVDWKKAYVGYKFQLEGDDQTAAKYQYLDAFAEAWGRTMYGGMSRWCAEHNVKSIGHFWEHNRLYYTLNNNAGDMTRLLKYSDMGGIDATIRQFEWNKRITTDSTVYQSPKLGSSVSHVFNKQDHLTFVEIFGNRGQDVTYPEMKWWVDHMLVSGINFFIPHSFNPRAPRDVDNPPFFFMDEYEPRSSLYHVFADYSSRSSLLLTGGKHVAPVAFLYFGNTINVGKGITFENMSAALQNALYDCDLLPFEVFEKNSVLEGREIKLYGESYKILVIPPVEVIPYSTLLKAKEFFDKGGVVLGYGFLPSRSATIGRTGSDIAELRQDIWGDVKPGLSVCKVNNNGGRSYFLNKKPTPEQLQTIFAGDAGIHPTLEVIKGGTDNWLHVLHRIKEGHDIFFITNQNVDDNPREFTFRITAEGYPECWDAMRNEITSVKFKRNGKSVDMTLSMQPNESVFIIFQDKKRGLPSRNEPEMKQAWRVIAVDRDLNQTLQKASGRQPGMIDGPAISGANRIWFPGENAQNNTSKGTRYFRKTFALSESDKLASAVIIGMANSKIDIYINGKKVESDNVDRENGVIECDVTGLLKPGANLINIAAANEQEQQPGSMLCKLTVQYSNNSSSIINTDNSWKVSNQLISGWISDTYDDSQWVSATTSGRGAIPGYRLYTFSPVILDEFRGNFDIPSDLKTGKYSVYLETDKILPEAAANVKINGKYVGGFIGKPLRIDVTKYMKKGLNTLLIDPFAPESVNIVILKK